MTRSIKSKLANTIRSTALQLGTRKDESVLLGIGHLEASLLKSREVNSLADAEFRIFSQWGEDGIIQHLINQVPITNPVFVEFGVQSYEESNTRFLMINNNWSGLIIDADDAHRKFLKKQGLDWRYNIQPLVSFITRENINQLIGSAGIEGDIGLLSVDIDGVDYWILDAINVVNPQIVIVEYNPFWGPEHAVTVPYQADFFRTDAHYSNFYWGASLKAFHHLLSGRNYAFVGCNSAGNNAFFVHRGGEMGLLTEVSVEDGYVPAQFWEYRLPNGELDYSRDRAKLFRELAEFELVDVIRNRTVKIGDLNFN